MTSFAPSLFSGRARLALMALLLAAGAARAQAPGVRLGPGPATAPDVSAALEIVSADKGLLLPRVAAATALATPAQGLLVFQTGSPAGFYYNAGGSGVGAAPAPKWLRLTDADGVRYDPSTGLQVGPGPVAAGAITNTQPVGAVNGNGTPGGPYRLGLGSDVRAQYLVRAADLLAAGVVGGRPLTALGFTVASKGSTVAHQNFTIRLGNTALTTQNTTFVATGLTQVFAGSVTTNVGLNTHVFQTPFVWDGTSNLVVQTCYDNSASNNSDNTTYTNTAYAAAYVEFSNTAAGCSLAAGGGQSNNVLPVFTLTQTSTAPAGAYTLPAVAGAAGQVLTQQASGSVAFQAPALALNGQNLSIGGGNAVTLPPGDDLGSHQATQPLRLNDNWLNNDGGAEGLRVDNTGRVGIGTASPQQALDVAGTTRTTGLQLTGGTLGAGRVLTSDAGGNATWQPAALDNLGNHTATQELRLGLNKLSGGTAATPGNSWLQLYNAPLAMASAQTSPLLRLERSTTANVKYSNVAEWALGSYSLTTTAAAQTRLDLTLNEGNTQNPDMTVASFLANGSLGLGTTAPNGAALLDLSSSTRGLLPPRLTQPQRDAVTSTGVAGGAALGAGQAGLTVFNTTSGKINVWDGTAWTEALATGQYGALPGPVSFGYTGGTQNYTVPAGVTQLRVRAQGAGGNGSTNFPGGLGGTVTADLTVVPGQVLTLVVGGRGRVANNGYGATGGYGGGAYGNSGGSLSLDGGGATDVRTAAGTNLGLSLGQRLLVAGGGGGYATVGFGAGGGGGAASTAAPAGSGRGGQADDGGTDGGLNGGAGGDGGGGGGLSSGGGRGGSGGSSGSSGSGGDSGGFGGGGGGGYFGGGGGVSGGGGGGGGSSWVAAAGSSNVSFGLATGSPADGSLTLTPLNATIPAPVLDAANFTGQAGQGLPAGAVAFSDGSTLAADAPNFTYDNVNNRLGIGTASPTKPLEVAGTVLTSGPGAQYLVANRQNATPEPYSLYADNAGLALWSRPSGNMLTLQPTGAGAGIYLNTGLVTLPSTNDGSLPVRINLTTGKLQQGVSARRYKADIHDLEPETVARYLALRPRAYRYKTCTARQVGLIAEEVEELVPDLVVYSPNPATGQRQTAGVDYERMGTYNLAALQAQQRRIEALEAENQALKTQGATDRAAASTDHASLLTLQAQMAQLLGQQPQARK